MVSSSVSLTALNINKLNSSKETVADRIKNKIQVCAVYKETKFRFKDTHRHRKLKGRKNIP